MLLLKIINSVSKFILESGVNRISNSCVSPVSSVNSVGVIEYESYADVMPLTSNAMLPNELMVTYAVLLSPTVTCPKSILDSDA